MGVCKGISGPCTRARWVPDPPRSAGIRPFHGSAPGTLNSLCVLHLGAVYFMDLCHPTDSCEPCPTSWLPFQGSCYFFSVVRAGWEEAQRNCAGAGAHLVIVGNLDEQVRGQFFVVRGGRRSSPQGAWLGCVCGRLSLARQLVSPSIQGFLSRNTRGRGYWLGLRAVRHASKVQSYQWVDGVSLSFR